MEWMYWLIFPLQRLLYLSPRLLPSFSPPRFIFLVYFFVVYQCLIMCTQGVWWNYISAKVFSKLIIFACLIDVYARLIVVDFLCQAKQILMRRFVMLPMDEAGSRKALDFVLDGLIDFSGSNWESNPWFCSRWANWLYLIRCIYKVCKFLNLSIIS